MSKGFWGVITYLATSYFLGLLSQLGREHAKDIAYKHNRYAYEKDRQHSRQYGFAPPHEARTEFMPEVGVHGKERYQEGAASSEQNHQADEVSRSKDWLR